MLLGNVFIGPSVLPFLNSAIRVGIRRIIFRKYRKNRPARVEVLRMLINVGKLFQAVRRLFPDVG